MKTPMIKKRTQMILAAIGLLILGAVDSWAGQVRIIEYNDDFPNGVFVGVGSWAGVTGEAWVMDDGSVFGGALYDSPGGDYWGEAYEYTPDVGGGLCGDAGHPCYEQN